MKTILLFPTLFLLLSTSFLACSGSAETAEDISSVPLRIPKMIGGQQALYEVLRYPDAALRNGIQGRVVLQFELYEDGSVHNIEVLQSAGNLLDKAAIRALGQMKYKPGVRDGEYVKMEMTTPVIFRIQ